MARIDRHADDDALDENALDDEHDDGHDDAHDDAVDENELDDDALSWDGDEELGRATSLTDPNPSGARRRRRIELSADDDADFPLPDDPDAAVGPDAPRPPVDRLRAAGTVLFGIVFLVWSIGWILSVSSAPAATTGAVVTDAMTRFGDFLTLIAAPIWFAAAVYLTREARTRSRMIALVVGAVLLVPWPTVIGLLA